MWKAGPYQYLPLRHQVIGACLQALAGSWLLQTFQTFYYIEHCGCTEVWAILPTNAVSDMRGQGKWANCVHIFFSSFALTKRFDFKIPQLFWKDFVLWSLKIISFWSKQNKLFCNFHCFLRPIGDFWVTFEVGIESSSQWSGEKKIKVVNCKFYNQITNHVTVLISEQFLESWLDHFPLAKLAKHEVH